MDNTPCFVNIPARVTAVLSSVTTAPDGYQASHSATELYRAGHHVSYSLSEATMLQNCGSRITYGSPNR